MILLNTMVLNLTKYSIFIPFVYQAPKILKVNNYANINVGNIPCKFFYSEFFFKAKNQSWIVLPPLLSSMYII